MQHPQPTRRVQRFHCPLASHPFMMKASSSSQRQGRPAMKCSVCGSESNADARFCANCGAKVNPGAETLFKTPVSPPPAAAAPVSDAGADASAAPRATNLVPVLLVLAALVVVGYFAYRAQMPEASPRESTAAEPAAPRTAPSAEAVQSGSRANPSASESAKSETAGAPPPRPATTEPPAAVSRASAPARPKAPTRTAAPKRPAVETNAPAPPAMAVAIPEPVAPAPPAPPPKPERIVQLNDALARCVGQDLIQRAVCEQRARLQHCEGYWGQVPQCPGGRAALQTN